MSKQTSYNDTRATVYTAEQLREQARDASQYSYAPSAYRHPYGQAPTGYDQSRDPYYGSYQHSQYGYSRYEDPYYQSQTQDYQASGSDRRVTEHDYGWNNPQVPSRVKRVKKDKKK